MRSKINSSRAKPSPPTVVSAGFLGLTLLILLALGEASAQETSLNKLKAAYVYNFLKYVEWSGEESLPVMDGPQMLERLFELYGRDATVVIAVSASVFDHQRRHYLDMGFGGFLDADKWQGVDDRKRAILTAPPQAYIDRKAELAHREAGDLN